MIFYAQLITWSSLNEPGSGVRITDVAIHPQNPDHILISGDMFGVSLSTDGGQSWHSTFGFRSYEMGAFTFHPSGTHTIWVGSMSGPYKSEEDGRNWEEKWVGMDVISETRLLNIQGFIEGVYILGITLETGETLYQKIILEP